MDIFSLNQQLEAFRGILNLGRGSIVDSVLNLTKIIVAIEIAFAGIYLAIGGNANLIEICRKILKIGAIFWLISFYPQILEWVYTGFLHIGLAVGSGSASTSLNVATLQNPDAILQLASNFINRVLQYGATSGAVNGWGLPTLTTIVILICALPTFLALGLIAINVFITYLEFAMIGSVAFALVPFALFKPFSWLFDRAQGAVISLGIKSMILALVVAMTDTILNTHPLSQMLTAPIVTGEANEALILGTVTFTNCAQFFLLCLTLLILSFHAPSLSVSLLGGGPQLTAGAIATAMRGTMHNLESSRSLGKQVLGSAASAVATPTMATLGTAAKFGGGARGAFSALRESVGNNSEKGSLVKGINQLGKTGMAAMYGATMATAGDTVKRAYSATGGRFERSLEDRGTRGEALGKKAVLNAANLFSTNRKSEETKNEAKPENKAQGEEKVSANNTN